MASIAVSKTVDKGSSPLTPARLLRYGVMVALQILVLSVWVRVPIP